MLKNLKDNNLSKTINKRSNAENAVKLEREK